MIFNGSLDSEHSKSEPGVKELSETLTTFGQLFETSNSHLNQRITKHTLKVKGRFKTGSFKINRISVKNIAQKAKNYGISKILFKQKKL
ncbi:MAG: hypothetical protein ACNYNY_01545 [Candidatus Oxydemutatoraceae bacterium WSBS_2016_MAG_OTU14]